MFAKPLKFPMHPLGRPPDLATCSHGRDLGDPCFLCDAEGLETVRRQHAAVKCCKGCNRPVGPWADYCAECTQEDETDCW